MAIDYIRKAVELADGFSVNRSDYLIEELAQFPIFAHTEMLPQWFLGALAAQLVRQCDAAGKDAGLYATVLIKELDQGECIDWPPDRAMDTIKAIVDSEVLT